MDESRILIVEDEVVVAVQLEEMLKKLGYAVCGIAPSGVKAIQKTEKENPDLILMDIMLRKEMDGIQTAKEIRKRSDIPIIYLTAFADQELVQKAKDTEPSGYMIKPYRPRELEIAIEFALYKHKAEKERKALTEQIKTLQGLLPICSCCKMIRDDQGCWHAMEKYIQKHSEAKFTHGICPDCSRKLYPELHEDDNS